MMMMMKIKTDREVYRLYVNDLPEDRKKYLSSHLKSINGEYWLYSNGEVLGGVCIDKDKNGIIWIRYLFSLKPGVGKKIVKYILREYNDSYIRLSCYGDKLKELYSSLGFIEYLKLPPKDTDIKEFYYEMYYYNKGI